MPGCKTEILPKIFEHLSILEEKLSFYFPSINGAQYDWIGNSFLETITEFSLTFIEELTAVSTDRGLLIKYKELSLEDFWISIKEEYASISQKALTIFF